MTASPGLVAAGIALIGLSLLALTRSVFAADGARTQLALGGRLAGRTGPLHEVSPRLKLLGLFALAVATSLLPPTRLWLPVGLVALLAVTSRVPARLLMARIAELAPFVVIAAVGALLAGDPARFATVLTRALVSVVALVVVMVTTPLPRLLRAARRLGLPALLVSLLGLALRYLVILMDEGGRMGQAFACRAVGPRDLRLARPLGRVVGALGVRTLNRSERVYQGMLARGYDGDFPTLEELDRPTLAQWLGAGMMAAVLLAGVLWP